MVWIEYAAESLGMFVFSLAVFLTAGQTPYRTYRRWAVPLGFALAYWVATPYHGDHFNVTVSMVSWMHDDVPTTSLVARMCTDLTAALLALHVARRIVGTG